MTGRLLKSVESSLHKVWQWRGWTEKDRITIKNMADQAAQLSRQYEKRAQMLKRDGVEL